MGRIEDWAKAVPAPRALAWQVPWKPLPPIEFDEPSAVPERLSQCAHASLRPSTCGAVRL